MKNSRNRYNPCQCLELFNCSFKNNLKDFINSRLFCFPLSQSSDLYKTWETITIKPIQYNCDLWIRFDHIIFDHLSLYSHIWITYINIYFDHRSLHPYLWLAWNFTSSSYIYSDLSFLRVKAYHAQPHILSVKHMLFGAHVASKVHACKWVSDTFYWMKWIL